MWWDFRGGKEDVDDMERECRDVWMWFWISHVGL